MNLFSTYFFLTLLFFFKQMKCEGQNPYSEALRSKSWKSIHKYVEVRPGAHIFYWFYYADGRRVEAYQKPLIIWIQGGPGLAATGVANFAEIGPLTMDMRPRNHTWVNGRNLLLIDHPVGTGFSYVDNSSLFVKTDKDAGRLLCTYIQPTNIEPQIVCSCRNPKICTLSKDLFRVIKEFFKTHKEFRKTPTYLFGQSYGGKLCPRLGYHLQAAIKNKRLKMNFRGIGIGSGWVDPKQSSLVQPEFLYNMGVIDLHTYVKAMKVAKQIGYLIEKKEYITAGKLYFRMNAILNYEAGMEVNFNNINQPDPYSALDKLASKVNKYVKPTLLEVNQTFVWNYISEDVFQSLNNSFLIPSTKFLETLLNHTKLKIAIYNGNLDVVTPLAGATNWVHALRWHGAQEFMNAGRVPIRGRKNGFYKVAKQLSFWSVFGSGHWVPEDNPEAMEHILQYMMDDSYSNRNLNW